MPNPYGGGILGGMLAGWRMGDEDHRTNQEFKAKQEDATFQRQRQQTADARTEQEFSWRAADRPGDVAFRDEGRGQQRKHWAYDANRIDQDQEKYTHDLRRRPMLEAREADLHAARIAAERHQSQAASMQAELMRLGIDDKKLASRTARNNALMSQAFAYGKDSGDWSELMDGFNAGPGSDLGVKLAAMTYAPDGTTIVATTTDGKTMKFKDHDELGKVVAAYGDPSIYAQSLLGAANSRNAEPANIQEARTLAGWRAKGDQGSLDAYEQVRTGMRDGGAFDGASFGGNGGGSSSRGGARTEPPPTASSIPDAAAAHLRANPSMRSAFDAKYGVGASASVLGR